MINGKALRQPAKRRPGFTVRRLTAYALFIAVSFSGTALGHTEAYAGDLNAGVAANFMLPFEKLSRLFQEQTGTRVKATYTSTGHLYAQIRHGAPYDIFLAADETRPALLYDLGLGETPFVYARGRVVVWSAKRELLGPSSWKEVMLSPHLARIALANPETAPYGAAACEALKRTGLWRIAEPKLVFAQTVSQAFQFAHTLSADAGFCALSAARSHEGAAGRYWAVSEAPAIVQAAMVLERGREKPAAAAFAAFLLSDEARAVKETFGYE